MTQVQEEVARAIRDLSLNPDDIRRVDPRTNRAVVARCLDRFVRSGNRQWWWEDFKQQAFTISNIDEPFAHLREYIPDLTRHVWLILEDDDAETYPVYDCDPKVIGSLIGECFGFEYYVVDKGFEWLLCENHHSTLIGAGNFDP